MDNEKLVMDTFKEAGIPLSAKEVAEISGIDKKEVDKLIKNAQKCGSARFPRRDVTISPNKSIPSER